MIKIIVQYFAILREQRGLNKEEVLSNAKTAVELYAELRQKHNFSLNTDILKVAINDEFCDWTTTLKSGDQVVFIPPVAGG